MKTSRVSAIGNRIVPKFFLLLFVICSVYGLAACDPVVRVEAPREPITINLNIKLDAEVRVKLEEQAQQDIASNPDIF